MKLRLQRSLRETDMAAGFISRGIRYEVASQRPLPLCIFA